jgi:ketosteroid isomerase-like protein
MMRKLEFFSKANKTPVNLNEIESARNDWMQLCNQHNAIELIRKAYTSDAIYYSHKPLIIGTDAITKEYSYMNQPNYSLHLDPIVIEPVNDHIVFEIGQCSGSYNGNYVLVWKKQKDGSWQVFFDSNI